ncbi:O-antigen translocase [Cochleicola gelatinilyticus]|nr:O-antigen translocase [Cochleicola gelatinilyticus]
MTSLNAGVIVVRLFVAFFLQRELTEIVGKAGYAKIGSLRNLLSQLSSFTSLGVFTGIVKYVSEYKEDKEQLQKLFSTTFVFTIVGSVIAFVVLFFGAEQLSTYYFYDTEYAYVLKLLAVIVPFISIQRVFNGVVNGLSKYKSFAKIELFAYLLSAGLTLFLLYKNELDGALIAIALAPVIQVVVLLYIFVRVLREYVQFSKLNFKIPFAKQLLAFTAMSFVSTLLLNQVEIEIRNFITNKVSETEAGIWTGMTTLSKNYMVFAAALFNLYVIPKFAGIYTKSDFTKEVLNIYKTLLPLFGVGMLVIYFARQLFIDYVFIDFDEMNPLFKWQLLGDFVRLASLVLAHQFLAKKMVLNFIFTELFSLALFYVLSYFLLPVYGVEGVVIAHFIRYVLYFLVVLLLVMRYFRKKKKKEEKLA